MLTQVVERPEVPSAALLFNWANIIIDPSAGNSATVMRYFELFDEPSERHVGSRRRAVHVEEMERWKSGWTVHTIWKRAYWFEIRDQRAMSEKPGEKDPSQALSPCLSTGLQPGRMAQWPHWRYLD